MPENRELKESEKDLDASNKEDVETPLTRILDEFLKDRTNGTVANAKDTLLKPKDENDRLNDQINPNYKRYDGREALRRIENPARIPVQITLDENQRPVSYSNEKREINIKYTPDGHIEKVSVNAKEKSSSPYWSEAEIVSFEKNESGSMIGKMQLRDGRLAHSRGPLTDFNVEPNGAISYFDNFFRHKVQINMDNSVTSYGRENRNWQNDPQPETFETYRRDGTKQLRIFSLDGAKLTIEGVPATIYQDSDRVVGFSGIAPNAALLQTKDGGKIVFLPNKDGTYMRAAFDPKGNLSTDVMFNKPLPRFIDEISSSKNLGVKWSNFDKGGVRFTITGTPYSFMDNVDYYLDYKRDKGR